MYKATNSEVQEWIKEARKKLATHLLIVCDTFSDEDYHVFVYSKGNKPQTWDCDDLYEAKKKYTTNMQVIKKIYDLSK
jgi:hypothetical protein